MSIEYTKEEYEEFCDLVRAGESRDQLERIRSRLDFPHFIERVGKEKCDFMFKVFCEEEGKNEQAITRRTETEN